MSETEKSHGVMVGNTNGDDAMDSLRVPLLDVQPVAVDADLEAAEAVRSIETTAHAPPGERTGSPAAFDIVIDDSEWDHGEVQPKACRDWFWGVLFLLQFVAIVAVAVMGIRNTIRHGFDWNSDDDDNNNGGEDNKFDQHTIGFFALLLCVVIAVPSALLNLLLVAFSSMLIQISLILSPLSFFVAFIGSFATMNCPVALFSLIMAVLGIKYATAVWHKVPFATANLQIALASIRDNHGLWIVAYIVTLQSWIWIFIWCSAMLELVFFSPGWLYDCENDDNGSSSSDDCTLSTRGKFIGLGMLLSMFWTSQVISNIYHTTIAGVVGTWWFDPSEARSASASGNSGILGCSCGCTKAIFDSWIRSGIDSLGSIAFGSLLVGVMKVLQLLVRCGRQQRDQQRRLRGIEGTDLVFCLLQYFVDSLERLMEYFNSWAFVYIGLYGYDYWTAGKQVSALFKARGWDVIINDNLVSRSLSMMSLFISLITGLVAVLLGIFHSGLMGAVPAFVLGFFLGASSCQILFGVVTSAVNTVVVCFAESPNQLKENDHDPKHFRSLIEAWRKAYPDDCGF